MSAKHKTYNTGFAGAKVVCAADKPVADWTAADRETLLEATASLLEELDGAMYTGCDMNTTPAMMQKLHDSAGAATSRRRSRTRRAARTRRRPRASWAR